MGAPLFDSAAAALRFAYAGGPASPASPVMVREMAAMVAQARKKLVRGASESKRRPAQPAAQLRGLDRTAQAGLILAAVARLSASEQNVLAGRYAPKSHPCSCGAPCCQRWRTNPIWQRAAEGLATYLGEEAQIRGIRGRLGISTEPRLRLMLVERFLLQRTDWTMSEIGRHLDISPLTVTKHVGWIDDALEGLYTRADYAISAIFDIMGITGELP